MPETDESRKLQKITRLLEKGGTMLATHHECGAPLFRYQGKVLCPVCDFEEKKAMPEAGLPEARAPETKRPETRALEMREPEAKRPQAGASGARKPEARIPEAREQEAERAAGDEGIRREVIPVREPQPAELSRIAELTQSKIHSIAQSLEDETDLQRVKEKLECIELGLRVLKLLGS